MHAGDAVQLAFVALLHPQLADVFGAPVVAVFILFFDAIFLPRIDAADVADHMAGQLPMGILAKQPGLDFDTRETVLLC